MKKIKNLFYFIEKKETYGHLNRFSSLCISYFKPFQFAYFSTLTIQPESPERAASFSIFVLQIICSLQCEKCIRKKVTFIFTTEYIHICDSFRNKEKLIISYLTCHRNMIETCSFHRQKWEMNLHRDFTTQTFLMSFPRISSKACTKFYFFSYHLMKNQRCAL